MINASADHSAATAIPASTGTATNTVHDVHTALQQSEDATGISRFRKPSRWTCIPELPSGALVLQVYCICHSHPSAKKRV